MELLSNHLLDILLLVTKISHSHLTSMLETNGETVSIPLEINNHVDHAGLLVEVKLYQTDSVLHQVAQLMFSSLLKTWYHVIIPTWDVMKDG